MMGIKLKPKTEKNKARIASLISNLSQITCWIFAGIFIAKTQIYFAIACIWAAGMFNYNMHRFYVKFQNIKREDGELR